MLDKLLGGSGFTIMMLGAAGMDSEKMILPIGIMVIGFALLAVGAFISDEVEQKNRP